MTTQFFCKNKDRWKKVSESNFINGIDYLEISSADQKTLNLYFLHDLPDAPASPPASPPESGILTHDNIFITGGVRIRNIVVIQAIPDPAEKNVLKIIVDQAGDFSNYILKVGNSLTNQDTPPPGFDLQLSAVEFSFKVNCPGDFDCKPDVICPPDIQDEPVGNYLAKDYASFNRLMLDRLSIIMPDWKERNAADLQVALVELMAYMGDHLSYYQDAVATEAYLEQARRRTSLKRHARLLDYFVHDGCNARVWVQVQVEFLGNADGKQLPAGTMLLTNGDGNQFSINVAGADKYLSEWEPLVFETMHNITLHHAHNRISFYTWEDSNCCLPKGCTHATLVDEPALALAKVMF
jgi:hypothetical protein